MTDREQFMLRQAAKFDNRVRNELGMSANDVLKAFSEGRLKDSNIEQQLQQARQEVAREIIQYIEDQGKVSFGSIMNRDIVCDIDDRDIAKLKQHFGLEG